MDRKLTPAEFLIKVNQMTNMSSKEVLRRLDAIKARAISLGIDPTSMSLRDLMARMNEVEPDRSK